MRKNAFTLAEVLITLAIIGIVAALTIPVLIQTYQNKVVETKLVKFYSAFNQALALAEIDYGDRITWYKDSNSYETNPETGEIIPESCEVTKWWNKYIAPYMPTIAIKYDDSGLPIFYFKDGSALKAGHTTRMSDWIFYTLAPEKCDALPNTGLGVCKFNFLYQPAAKTGTNATRPAYKYMSKSMDTYKYCWDGKIDSLYTGVTDYCTRTYLGCNDNAQRYCSTIIQLNNWKIPKDYPFKVKG